MKLIASAVIVSVAMVLGIAIYEYGEIVQADIKLEISRIERTPKPKVIVPGIKRISPFKCQKCHQWGKR